MQSKKRPLVLSLHVDTLLLVATATVFNSVSGQMRNEVDKAVKD